MNMSDRIAIMNNGRIEQVGRPADIYENPANHFIARFLGEANLIDGVIESIGDSVATLKTAGGAVFRARAEPPLRVGDNAHLFVRPERVSIAPATADDDGAVDGRLVQTAFLGNILRHTVEIEPGVRVTVDVQNAGVDQVRGRGAARVGETVALSWRVADGLILPR